MSKYTLTDCFFGGETDY